MAKSNLINKNKTKKTKKASIERTFQPEVYLDYAAGVRANASSIHALGVIARKELENARALVSMVLGSRPNEVIFTSGGTESNNLAIQGVVLRFLEMFKSQKPHIITTNIEHPSVLETFRILEKRKLVDISIVPVEENGIVDPKKIKKAINKNTILVSVMYANNEIGTIQPIREIAKEIRHYKKHSKEGNPWIKNIQGLPLEYPLFHTDAVQAVNYLDLNVEKLGVDLLSLSGSKIEEAGRVGVLYKKKSVLLSPVLAGGDQEMGLRPGTENLPEVLKFSKALEFVQKNKNKEVKRLTKLRNYFIRKLYSNIEHSNDFLIINGDLKNRLPNNINITFSKIPSDLLVVELSAYGIMCSSKSACKSSHKEGSYVIEAIRKETDIEIGGLRFSLGRKTTKTDIDYTIKTLNRILDKLTKWYLSS